MSSNTLNAQDVADYFLANADELGPPITNMVLQKLVYYAQGFHLALQGEPLFGEEIEAWEHGPVLPDLYDSYKIYGKSPIDLHDLAAADIEERLAPEVREILDVVQSVYGKIDAWHLSRLTHAEPPWTKTSASGRSSMSC